MDASIMDGLTFKCGSVAAVSNIEHPITLAKYILNNFPNSIFVGEGAKNLAKYADLNWISDGYMESPMARLAHHSENEKYETDADNKSLLGVDMLTNSLGTVGCVAFDGHSIAAGTTTGGLNKKLVGRVGDTPILGCGTYSIQNEKKPCTSIFHICQTNLRNPVVGLCFNRTVVGHHISLLIKCHTQ
ncbi:uncharacterized protein LOC143145299 [Ptiloglossa arizonensis]|uniref:uncharacterized protein LOC143145299 n=1 Tax=Ptiloglossa arizonensis TaxID=3350558 RepID=UPI003F9F3E7E